MAEQKQWVFPKEQPTQQTVAAIAKELNLFLPTARLLALRGNRTPEQASCFLSMGEESFHDAFAMQDMEKAVARIEQALEQKEKITVYGDYDVDGVTSTATLYLYLRSRGAEVNYYIPRRLEEGYGMNLTAVQELIEQGSRLFITVDTGITAVEEAEKIAQLGADLLITDHHACRLPLPRACAVVNPHREDCDYPFQELAGVGVVFKLLCALEQSRCEAMGKDPLQGIAKICAEYGDLVALGTIADVMPLVDENRLIVRYGLHCMDREPRLGIRALLSAAGADQKGRYQKRRITSSVLGFTLAPRINAAGRLGDARRGVELFLQESEFGTAEIAHELCELNKARQLEENRIAKEALELIETQHDLSKESVLVLAKEGWHQGVIGIVASRITERYHMPCILISLDAHMGKGSGRSIHGLHLVEALTACAEYLTQFGGHELAAGLSIEKDQVEAFAKAVNAYAQPLLGPESRIGSLKVDMELKGEDITLPLVEELDLLEPFGAENPQPVFVLRDVEIVELQGIGNGKHTKLLLQAGMATLTALYFGMAPEQLEYGIGDRADVAFTLDVNDFQGNRTVQLLLKDMTYAKQERGVIAKGIIEYANLTAKSGKLTQGQVPDYARFGTVYRALRKCTEQGNPFVLPLQRLYRLCNKEISHGQLRVIVEVFAQLHFLNLSVQQEDPLGFAYRIEMLPQCGKVKLENSPLYCQMKEREEN